MRAVCLDFSFGNEEMRLLVLNGSYDYGQNKWGSNFTLFRTNFSTAYWRNLHFVLFSRFERHFVEHRRIDACIYFGPPTWLRKKVCADVPTCPSGKLTIYVEEATDADHAAYKICPKIWSVPCDRRIVRITGGLPGRLVKDARLASCKSVEVPWLTHIRGQPALPHAFARTKRICMATGILWHYVGNSLGFTSWRKSLLEECRKRVDCHTHPAGHPIKSILKFYSGCHMCVQPPGDMLMRPGIIDAMSVGCIPVLLHKKQRAFWPSFWNARKSTLMVDMNSKSAAAVLDRLNKVSLATLSQKRRDGYDALPHLSYNFEHDSRDAFSHLISILSRRAMLYDVHS